MTPVISDELVGVQVVEACGAVAGAAAGRLLARLGASVVRITDRDDRIARYGPFDHLGRGGLDRYLNGLKHVVRGDGSDIALLAARADIVVTDEDFGPVADVDAPAVVFLHVSHFGSGPRQHQPSTPLTRFHAGGQASVLPAGEADPARQPVRAGVLSGDLAAGAAVATAALMHYVGRLRTGRGCRVEVSEHEYAACGQKGFLHHPLALGRDLDRAAQALPMRGVFRCADGWMMILVVEPHHWTGLLEVLDHDEWRADGGLRNAAVRADRRDELAAVIDVWASERRRDEVFARCQTAGVPASPVIDPADIPDVDYFSTTGFLEAADLGAGPALRLPTVPWRRVTVAADAGQPPSRWPLA